MNRPPVFFTIRKEILITPVTKGLPAFDLELCSFAQGLKVRKYRRHQYFPFTGGKQ